MVMGRVVAATPGQRRRRGRARRASGRRRPTAPPRRAAELTSRERRERALLAMCIALPEEGAEYLARLTDAHLSPTGLRAAAWLREHPGTPPPTCPTTTASWPG